MGKKKGMREWILFFQEENGIGDAQGGRGGEDVCMREGTHTHTHTHTPVSFIHLLC